MDGLVTALVSVLPILLLIMLGAVLRRAQILDDSLVEGLKRLVVTVVLPAVLFTAFVSLGFEAEHGFLTLIVPVACFLLLALGWVFRALLRAPQVSPFLFTGFEFGMVGLALITAVYGLESAPLAAVAGLGHEFFIWFVFVTLLRHQSEGTASFSEVISSFVRSPVINAIALGLLINVLGWSEPIAANPVGAGIFGALEYLAALIVPLILIIIGYGTNLNPAGVGRALPLVLARYVICLALAIFASRVVVGQWLQLGAVAEAAVFTILILPPPFIVPLFLPSKRADEIAYSNNVLSVYTLLTVVTFVIYVLVA